MLGLLLLVQVCLALETFCWHWSEANQLFPGKDLYEPMGYSTEESVAVLNTCPPGKVCSVYTHTFNFTSQESKKLKSSFPEGFGFSWTFEKELYAYGGKTPNGVGLADLYRVGKDHSVKLIEVLGKQRPLSRSYASLSLVEGVLVLFGGEKEEHLLGDLWTFSLESKTWKQVHLEEQVPRKAHSSFKVRFGATTYIVYFGGKTASSYLNEVLVLRVTSKGSKLDLKWVEDIRVKGTVPSPREGHSVYQKKGTILISGGCNYSIKKCFSDVYSLSVHFEDKFTLEFQQLEIQNKGVPREQHLSLDTQQGVLLVGGHNKFPSKSQFLIEAPCTPLLAIECPCKNKGVCQDGKCLCEPGYFGELCEYKHCQSTCGSELQRGSCNHKQGKCECYLGFEGDNCELVCENCKNYKQPCNGKGVIVEEECQCLPGFCGKFCENACNDCSGHGVFDGEFCKCDKGFEGANCEKTCLNRCSKHGECFEGRCVCDSGWEGEDCSVDLNCSENCNSNGICQNGQCKCFQGYSGEACQVEVCPSNCTVVDVRYEVYYGEKHSFKTKEDIPLKLLGEPVYEVLSSRGFCTSGGCECKEGFSGKACQITEECPKDCSGNGECKEGMCRCSAGWGGRDCSLKVCPNNCNHNGQCIHGICECYSGYFGEDCADFCPNNCSGNGVCKDTHCKCYEGYEGSDCSVKKECNCNGRGECRRGMCYCEPGYFGKNCEEVVPCPHNCNSNGECIKGKCQCSEGWSGEACEEPKGFWAKCKFGKFLQGECRCSKGFTGRDCSVPVCKGSCKACSGRGVLFKDKCYCEPDYTGVNCEIPFECKNSCSGNGVCEMGKCHCNLGFAGEDCSQEVSCLQACPPGSICSHGTCFCTNCTHTCENSCSGNGVCKDNKCICQKGFFGTDCSLTKSNYCGRGVLRGGMCDCEVGWTGNNCTEPIPLNCPGSGICSGNGKCLFGKCHCYPDFEGKDCSKKKQCPDNCNGKGICKYGKCFCEPGYEGKACQKQVSIGECQDCKGVCYQGKCSEDQLFIQQSLTNEHCPLGCSGKGFCVNNKCLCEEGWTGEACEKHVLQEGSPFCEYEEQECAGNGICYSGKCYCDPQYTGKFCERPLSCQNCIGPHKACIMGNCVCEESWGGKNCTEDLSCKDLDCGSNGFCFRGKCFCEEGYTLFRERCLHHFWETGLVTFGMCAGLGAILLVALYVTNK